MIVDETFEIDAGELTFYESGAVQLVRNNGTYEFFNEEEVNELVRLKTSE